MKEKIKDFFRLNGKYTTKQRNLEKECQRALFKAELKEILVTVGISILISLLICAFLFGNLVVHAEETRTVDFRTGFTSNYDESNVADHRYDVSVTGTGNFNVRGYFFEQSVGNTNTVYRGIIYLLSNEDFSYSITSVSSGATQKFSATEEDGVYYSELFDGTFFCRNGETITPYGTYYYTFSSNLTTDWNAGSIDLTQDNYDSSETFTVSETEVDSSSNATTTETTVFSCTVPFEVARIDYTLDEVNYSEYYALFTNYDKTETLTVTVDGTLFASYYLSDISSKESGDNYYGIYRIAETINGYYTTTRYFQHTADAVDYIYNYGEYTSTIWSEIFDMYINGELLKDTENEETQPTYIYNSALDFAQISAEYNLKYTIKKDLTGAWNFISPSEAGIQFHWTNNRSVDDAYLKFDIYGTFYDSMWATSGTYTHITVSDVNKSDCAYLLQQNNLVELARQANGVENGHGLDINYIYVQAYGTVDGVLSRSRIYKFNNELISDYGNADSEYDEYVPEITSGVSLPVDYELDETLTDPEVVEPDADTTSTTVITTPVDDLDYTSYYDEESLLKALTKFYDMLKNIISTLGQFPTLFANVFSFLPAEITVLICGSLLACIFLRFIGR
ncbi:MAG: hypothetical protein IJ326_05400 [Lachnospiraceae bacterium]|nr:hypothetical protein [Lachnospiraceae bacterium]